MAKKWTNPELGKFEYDGLDWVTTVSLNCAAPFVYRRPRGKRSGIATLTLAFEVDDEDELPSPGSVSLAVSVVANADLFPLVVNALWGDINGHGPASSMWWHGDLGQVAFALADAALEAPLREAADLYRVMQPYQIRILKGVERYRRPIGEIDLRAAFEEEHGVGVLTDGVRILGIGSSSNVVPFKEPRKRPAKPSGRRPTKAD